MGIDMDEMAGYWLDFEKAKTEFLMKLNEHYRIMYRTTTGNREGHQYEVGDVLEDNRLFVYISHSTTDSALRVVEVQCKEQYVIDHVLSLPMVEDMRAAMAVLHRKYNEREMWRRLQGVNREVLS